MPVKDGFQASLEISEFYKSNKIEIKNFTIAAHSAFWDEEAQRKANIHGISTSIPKPLKYDSFKEVVSSVFKSDQLIN